MNPIYHAYHFTWTTDGDYIVYQSLQRGRWTEHTRWLIPGTQLED